MRRRISGWISGRRFERVLREIYVEYRNLIPTALLSGDNQKARKYDRDTVRIARQSMGLTSAYVDAGAHAGTLLKEFIKIAPLGRGFAFEPIPALSDALRTRFPSISVEEVALGSTDGTAQFRHLVDDPANSSLYIRPDREMNRQTRSFEVKIKRLDDCVPENLRVDFIKIDVEGAELELLKGAQRILSCDHPVIVFESVHSQLAEIGNFLTQFDMSIQLLTDYLSGTKRNLDEVLASAASGGEYYFVAARQIESSE